MLFNALVLLAKMKKLRDFLKSNKLGGALWDYLHRGNINLRRVLSDKAYFKLVYWRNCGEWLDFNAPQTFDAKQLWLKMYYRNPLCTLCSDKYAVREYVRKKGLSHILNELYAVYDSVEQIEWDKLPNMFYMKANNMSGCNMRCNDLKSFDKSAAIRYFKKRMKYNYYYESREWNYRDISPKIIIEKILPSTNEAGLIDYRFLCAQGKCHYVFIDIDTADMAGHHKPEAKRNVYDRDMNLLDVQVSRERFDPSLVSKPDNWDEMVAYAEILSGNFPFCRVDLYNINGKILFGEITFFHAGGLSVIYPKEWAYKLGEMISIDYAKRCIE